MFVTVAEISRRLSDRAEEVCRYLIPGGRVERGEYKVGDVLGGPGKSLSVHLTGEHAGQWKDWANPDDHGDLLDLWRSTRGLSAIDAIREAKNWLGIKEPETYAPRSYSKPKDGITRNIPNKGTAFEWLSEKRKIDWSIINRFKVEGSVQYQAIAFPCYSPKGDLVNRSYRTLTEPKKVFQDKGCPPSLFGWQGLSDEAFKNRSILLCEGQIDCMTWTQWGIPALSVPNGSGQTWIDYEWDNLAVFDKIYVSFDMDGPGAVNCDRAISRLGRHRCLLVKLPKKDANDCLLAGYGSEEAWSWISDAKAPGVKGLVAATELKSRIVRECEVKAPIYTLPFLRGHDDEGRTGFYPRPGEVTVWSGITSSGKSTFINYFILSLLLVEQNVFVASMEMKAETLVYRMISSKFDRRPGEAEALSFVEECGPYLTFADKVGYIGQEELLEMMHYAFQRYGASHFFIDSLMCIDGLEEEYVKQGQFMNILTEFAKSTDAHVHLVAHPRKRDDNSEYGKLDIKGSSSIPNRTDNVVYISRNHEKDELRQDGDLTPEQDAEMYDTQIVVKKQRETGWLGSFYLKFDPRHFSFGVVGPNRNVRKQQDKEGKREYVINDKDYQGDLLS